MDPQMQAMANARLQQSIGALTMERDVALTRADVAEARNRELETELAKLAPKPKTGRGAS